MYQPMDLFTVNRGSKNSYVVRMVINGVWIVLGIIYSGFGMTLLDDRNMYRYVRTGGAYHNPMAEIVIGLIISAIAAYCLYRNYYKSQVTLTLTESGIKGKDSSGYSFSLPIHMIRNVRIIKNMLIIDTQNKQLVFKKVNSMTQMGNMILDAINRSNKPPVHQNQPNKLR